MLMPGPWDYLLGRPDYKGYLSMNIGIYNIKYSIRILFFPFVSLLFIALHSSFNPLTGCRVTDETGQKAAKGLDVTDPAAK